MYVCARERARGLVRVCVHVCIVERRGLGTHWSSPSARVDRRKRERRGIRRDVAEVSLVGCLCIVTPGLTEKRGRVMLCLHFHAWLGPV